MKRIILLFAAMFLITVAFSQSQMYQVPSHLQGVSVSNDRTDGSGNTPFQFINPTVNTLRAALEDPLGSTKYDRQSNKSTPQRIYLYPDGTVGATWMRGMEEGSWGDRGTGYNYFNGSGWGPFPTVRLESQRAGWTGYAPFGQQGELVVSHRSALYPLFLLTRDTKGTGSWLERTINAPAGASGVEFPRIVTNGPNNSYIHLLCLSGPTQFSGTPYNGMDPALLYSRSLDGGATWDIEMIQIPGTTSSEYLEITLDGFAWATPHGDTLAFVVGGNWNDTFLMMSTDNGDTWTKTIILPNSQCLVPSGTTTEKFACADGCVAVELDHQGTAHVVFGRMFAKGESDGQKYYPYTDGLVYWNSTMPPLHDSLFIDTLFAHGQLIGYIPDNPTDSIHLLPKYGCGLSSMPMITIDDDDNIFVLWSGVTLGAVSPDDFNFRHIWATGSTDNGATWSDMVDLNESILYMNMEFVYPSVSKRTSSENLHYIQQTADQPGSGVGDPTQIAIHECIMEYRVLPKNEVITYLAVENKEINEFYLSQPFPNPVHDMTTLELSLSRMAPVSITVSSLLGQKVQHLNKGLLPIGNHQVFLDVSNLTKGAYFISVNVGDQVQTRKMIVE